MPVLKITPSRDINERISRLMVQYFNEGKTHAEAMHLIQRQGINAAQIVEFIRSS